MPVHRSQGDVANSARPGASGVDEQAGSHRPGGGLQAYAVGRCGPIEQSCLAAHVLAAQVAMQQPRGIDDAVLGTPQPPADSRWEVYCGVIVAHPNQDATRLVVLTQCAVAKCGGPFRSQRLEFGLFHTFPNHGCIQSAGVLSGSRLFFQYYYIFKAEATKVIGGCGTGQPRPHDRDVGVRFHLTRQYR